MVTMWAAALYVSNDHRERYMLITGCSTTMEYSALTSRNIVDVVWYALPNVYQPHITVLFTFVGKTGMYSTTGINNSQ